MVSCCPSRTSSDVLFFPYISASNPSPNTYTADTRAKSTIRFEEYQACPPHTAQIFVCDMSMSVFFYACVYAYVHNGGAPCTQQFSGSWSMSESTAIGTPTTRGYPGTAMRALAAAGVCDPTEEVSIIALEVAADGICALALRDALPSSL